MMKDKKTVPQTAQNFIRNNAKNWSIEVPEFRNRKCVYAIVDNESGLVVARAVGKEKLLDKIDTIKQNQSWYNN